METRDTYKMVTDRMLEALERLAENPTARPPWVRPWEVLGGQRNGHSGHVYRGINALLTMLSNYADPRWYTYKQAAENYGTSHVRKGEKGTQIIKWLFLEQDTDLNGTVSKKVVPLCRTFTIFNHEQIEWEAGHEPQLPDLAAHDPAARYVEAMALVTASGATVQHGGDKAFYNREDHIQMPVPGQFKTVEDYWATMLHELVHWTGHSKRCNRSMESRFGDKAYAMEELVAEIGSAFLCNALGIEGKMQHTEYVLHWIKVLQDDKYALFTASRLAQNAVEFLTTGSKADTEAESEAGIEQLDRAA